MQSLGISDEQANQRVSDIHMEEIPRHYCKHWNHLWPYLGLERIVVSDIEAMTGSEGEKRRAFLAAWRERKGSEATYGRLFHALLKIDCQEDAEGVCKLLKSD